MATSRVLERTSIYREMKLYDSMEELQTTVDHTEGAGVVGIQRERQLYV